MSKELVASNRAAKLMTPRQRDAFWNMARAKGITCGMFQPAMDEGWAGRFLELLKEDEREIVPHPNGRVRIVRVHVKRYREWREAIDAGAPDSPANYIVRTADVFYPPQAGETDEDLALVNYRANEGDYDTALVWAETQLLAKTAPREVFATGECHPELRRKFGTYSMQIVATRRHPFEDACCVCWVGEERRADLYRLAAGYCFNVWFAFRIPNRTVR